MNSKIPNTLVDAIKTGKLVLFIGAGCSIPLQLPSWKKLIENILEELNTKYGSISDTNFQNILNGVQSDNKTLFEALSKIENDVDKGPMYKTKSKEIVNGLIEANSKILPSTSDIHDLLWQISPKIITTNYDKALEKYKPSTLDVKTFDNSNAFQVLKSQASFSSFLYKIHGDFENPDTIILFESDYLDLYKNENYNNDALGNYFKDYTLLFVGFSLKDPFVNDLFHKIKKTYNGYTVNEHFALTTSNEDFSAYDITAVQILDWEDDLKMFLQKLIEFKKPINVEILKIESTLESDDIKSAVELINKKTEELISNPSNRELHKEVKDLRGKLDEILYGKLDYQQVIDKSFRDTDLQILFETIYSSEKLNSTILQNIHNVRTNTSIYKWYDRSVIVSAISCSLIHFNKADEHKISLLIDFINDNEEKVWQRALTSLFIALNHLGNKWLRFPAIKDKIKSLNNNIEVQQACGKIINFYNIGLNNVNFLRPDIFKNPYFSDNPFNYFYPYHQEDNPVFNQVYDNYEDNNIEDFIEHLNQLPIPDQIKYLLCGPDKDEQQSKRSEQQIFQLNHILHYNKIFYPFSTYIQEMIAFYKFFPLYEHQEKLNSQLKLTETPLKDYLLNEKEKYSGLGHYFMSEKNWAQAIVNFKEVLKLDEKNISALLNLAVTYRNNKQIDNAINLRKKIRLFYEKDEKNLKSLYNLYIENTKEYQKGLEVAENLILINCKNASFYNLKGVAQSWLDDEKSASASFTQAILLDSNDAGFYGNRASSYQQLQKLELSLDDYNNAIKLEPKKSRYYYERAQVYYSLNRMQKALKDLNYCIILNKKNPDQYLERAGIKSYLKLFKEAEIDIKMAIKLNVDKVSLYQTYSNFYRLSENFEKAFEYNEKAQSIKADFRNIGTKATIYASMGNDKEFYRYLEQAFIEGASAHMLFTDIKNKYRNEKEFNALLEKYNQMKV